MDPRDKKSEISEIKVEDIERPLSLEYIKVPEDKIDQEIIDKQGDDAYLITNKEREICRSVEKVYKYHFYLAESAQANKEAKEKLEEVIKDLELFQELLKKQEASFISAAARNYIKDMNVEIEKLRNHMEKIQKDSLTHVQHFSASHKGTSNKEKFLKWKAESSPFTVAV